MAMSDVTRILSQIDAGDPAAAEQLLPLVYDELPAALGLRAGSDVQPLYRRPTTKRKGSSHV
jgi:hypothetical protein